MLSKKIEIFQEQEPRFLKKIEQLNRIIQENALELENIENEKEELQMQLNSTMEINRQLEEGIDSKENQFEKNSEFLQEKLKAVQQANSGLKSQLNQLEGTTINQLFTEQMRTHS